MAIALWLSFFAGFDFKGLWLGLMAAQASCMVTMLFVLARTNWEGQTQRAQELTSSDSSEDEDEDDEEEEEAEQKLKVEIESEKMRRESEKECEPKRREREFKYVCALLLIHKAEAIVVGESREPNYSSRGILSAKFLYGVLLNEFQFSRCAKKKRKCIGEKEGTVQDDACKDNNASNRDCYINGEREGNLAPKILRENASRDEMGKNSKNTSSVVQMSNDAVDVQQNFGARMVKLKPHKGITSLGFRCKDGIILASCSPVSTGTSNVMEIDRHMLSTMIGEPADKLFSKQCRSYESRKKQRMPVYIAAEILEGIIDFYSEEDWVGALIAGWEMHGPVLFCIDEEVACESGHRYAVGSGSLYAEIAMLDTLHCEMIANQAASFGRWAIRQAAV
ncbi:hypothetical protein K1719_020260 [Acacia pycnantha]|nr:hypothetical protein K1719_020260 [Acacia pycnantha]